MENIIVCIKYAIKKTVSYPANLVSWIMADLGMYISIILMYYILGSTINDFIGYDKKEILLFVANAFIINNLFSVFFSEATDNITLDIWNGKMYYSLLKPKSILLFYISKNVNCKSCAVFPVLAWFELYSLNICKVSFNIEIVFSIINGTIIMGLLFFSLDIFDFLGLKSEAFDPIVTQFLNLRERPDNLFGKNIRNIFIYIIPIFLTSAIPTRVQLGISSGLEVAWFWICPIVLYVICVLGYKESIKQYTFGTEG